MSQIGQKRDKADLADDFKGFEAADITQAENIKKLISENALMSERLNKLYKENEELMTDARNYSQNLATNYKKEIQVMGSKLRDKQQSEANGTIPSFMRKPGDNLSDLAEKYKTRDYLESLDSAAAVDSAPYPAAADKDAYDNASDCNRMIPFIKKLVTSILQESYHRSDNFRKSSSDEAGKLESLCDLITHRILSSFLGAEDKQYSNPLAWLTALQVRGQNKLVKVLHHQIPGFPLPGLLDNKVKAAAQKESKNVTGLKKK